MLIIKHYKPTVEVIKKAAPASAIIVIDVQVNCTSEGHTHTRTCTHVKTMNGDVCLPVFCARLVHCTVTRYRLCHAYSVLAHLHGTLAHIIYPTDGFFLGMGIPKCYLPKYFQRCVIIHTHYPKLSDFG